MKNSHLGHVIWASLSLAACGVPEEKYDAAVRDAHDANAAKQNCSADLARHVTDLDAAHDQIAEQQKALERQQKALADDERELGFRQSRIDGATAETAQLKKELERLGKNADSLLAEKGSLSGALSDAKARLEELRRAQAAAEVRAAIFRELALKFHKMIDAGQLKVGLRDGRMVIQLANDVLFDSGQTVIKPDGREALAQVAAVLKTFPERHFQIAGDTDNVPISNARFPSNWELSTARAVEVVRFLIAHGMAPGVLSASGYGEFDPVASNDTEAGRSKNRRIEITLQPNIDELVAVPDIR